MVNLILSKYLLMLQNYSHEKMYRSKHMLNLLQASYTTFIKKEWKTVTAKKIFKTNKC